MIERNQFYINGEWCDPATRELFDVVSPSSELVVGRVPKSTPADMDRAVRAARVAFDSGPWKSSTLDERVTFLTAFGDILTTKFEELVTAQIDEMGSPRSFMEPMTKAALDRIYSLPQQAKSVSFRELRDGSDGQVLVVREAVGVVAAIIPWNAPVSLITAKILPPLLMGCTVVLKPAMESPLSAYIVADAVHEAGFPRGVLNIVAGDATVGESLVANGDVDAVTFTGSSAAGERVGALCAKDFKRTTLECGGKSAAIILRDTDISSWLPSIIGSSLPNTGQVCFATTRVLVPEELRDSFVAQLGNALNTMPIGDPHLADTRFGPLVSEQQRARVESYIELGQQEGATLAYGGGRPEQPQVGWYVNPTVFTDVDNSMRIAQEEIFGPVLTVIDYTTEDEAAAIANDSVFGLGGAVFTDDINRGIDMAVRINTGTCQINNAPAGGGGGPFGGVKRSGIGRERDREGFERYLEFKSIALPRSSNDWPEDSSSVVSKEK